MGQGLFGNTGYLPGYLLLTELLRLPGLHLELLYVDGGVNVVLDESFGDNYRVLEVVSPPGHEGNQNVLPESELTSVGGLAVRYNVPGLHLLALLHEGPLVYTGVLVRSLELFKLVYVYPEVEGVGGIYLFGVHPYHYPRAVHLLHNSSPLGHDDRVGVSGHLLLHARPYKRCLGQDERNRLPLHVRSHQGPVSVVVFEEGYEGGRD